MQRLYWHLEPSREFFDVLTNRPELKRLTAFVGSHLGLRPADVPALAATFDPANLSRLALHHEPLGNDGAAAVVAAFAGSRLRELTLSWCGLKALGVVAVARSPLMGAVEKLDLSGNALGKSGVAALLEMDAPALRELVLGGCSVTPLEKRRLAKHFGARVKL